MYVYINIYIYTYIHLYIYIYIYTYMYYSPHKKKYTTDTNHHNHNNAHNFAVVQRFSLQWKAPDSCAIDIWTMCIRCTYSPLDIVEDFSEMEKQWEHCRSRNTKLSGSIIASCMLCENTIDRSRNEPDS